MPWDYDVRMTRLTPVGLVVAWPELLTSFAILEKVARRMTLYLAPLTPADSAAFRDFRTNEKFRPGQYVLKLDPRGRLETQRATEILQQARPADVVGHDLTKHGWERASAKHAGYWIQHMWLEPSPDTDCIYCRLFPDRSHSH